MYFLSILLFYSSAACAADNKKEVLFGSVAMDIPAVMYKRLSPLTEYLSQAIDRPVSLKLSPDMPAAIDDTANGRVDPAYLTPVAYLKAHAKGGARLVVRTVTNGKGSFRLMIVVKQDSPIKSVQDLVGKRIAFGYNISASNNVDDALLARLREAFLSLDEKNPAHVPIIKAVDKKYDGLAPTSDAEYDIVRELIKPFDNKP